MEQRMDKTVVRIVSLKAQGNDFEFWQTKSFEERLSVLEELRKDYFGSKNGIELRFQKDVCNIFMRKPRQRKHQKRDDSITQ